MSLRATQGCGEGFYDRDLTRHIEASLTPDKPVLLPGEHTMLSLAFKNVTNKDLGLVFRHGFFLVRGMGSKPEVEVFDEAGNYVTFAGDCGSAWSSGSGHYLVLIAPGGSAIYRREWEAATYVGRHDPERGCLFEPHPLPKGKYTLRMRAPLEASQRLADSVVEVEGQIEVMGNGG